ncbi:type II secretion system inner membrane protein GspF [Bacteriovorax sp. Seq25_V]|uniref:type II secretion system inner membrane protein GspF n=1 Tax=Bacteriovorax sp. Seq25_V TaxID=1201288 RepID=UPI000389D9F7|nr:type II secretion system inner membrane protein GspF [Bacteriovorax sp. Seq25_V]EQC46259.1 type II secretion system protein F [Bacteriovorax sp. Seq25_V]
MALYSYKGIDRTGAETKGSVNAENINLAKSKVRALGIMLTDIKEQKSEPKAQKNISFGAAVSINDLSLMTRQLATLIKARIQIVESFNALIEQCENPKLRVILSEVRQKVNEGSSLAKALSDYPKVFDTIYVNMVEAGESSGTLDIVLLRLAEFTEAQVKLKNKVRGAMMYPIIMLCVGATVMSIILVLVIPKITKIFVTLKKELPLPTQICIWLSSFIKSYWWAIILGIFAGIYLLKKYIATKKGRAVYDSIVLKIPVVGGLVTMVNVSRFCSTLGTLLNSGVPILMAMNIVKNLISNVHMQKAIERSRTNVSEGSSLAGPLAESKLFPVMVTHMISLGEKSGELEPMLNIIAENYEDQVESKLNGLTSILEPIMMVGMGGAVAFIVMSVVVPMMELNSVK